MSERGLWLSKLIDSPTSERGALLASLVSGAFKSKLLMSEADELPIDKSYFELGLTSLGAVELQQMLESAIDRRIDPTSFYNNPTLENLIGYLRNEVLYEYFGSKANVSKGAENASGRGQTTSEEMDSARNLLNEILG